MTNYDRSYITSTTIHSTFAYHYWSTLIRVLLPGLAFRLVVMIYLSCNYPVSLQVT